MSVVSKDVNLSFELINATVNVHSALIPKPVNVTVCCGKEAEHEPMKVRQVRHCSQCGEVAYADLRKARETGAGLVVFDTAELETVRANTAEFKKLATLNAHKREEVEASTESGEKLYYLTPKVGSEQAYAVLRHLVVEHPELAFTCLWTPRTNTSMFMLRVRGEVLVLQERARAGAVSSPPDVVADAPEQLLALAEQLLSLKPPVGFDPDVYADTYESDVQKLVDGKTPVTPGVAASPSGDLLEVLTTYMAEQVAVKPSRKKKVKV